MEVDGSVDVLILVLELHSLLVPCQDDTRKSGADLRADSERFVGQICTFLSMFQHINTWNRVAVQACTTTGVSCLYEDLDSVGATRQLGKPQGAACSVLKGLQDLCSDISNAPLDSPVDTRHMSAALSKAMCMVNRVKQAAELNDCTAHPRVLVLHTSADTTSQYVACMNAAFSARRLGVPVDGMPLTGQVSSYIELAANLSGGAYVQMKNPAALLQYLTCCFSASFPTRELMELPDAKGLSFKGTCFCHVKAIDSGFVCSVCLSVFCAPHDKCMTCGTVFTGVTKTQ